MLVPEGGETHNSSKEVLVQRGGWSRSSCRLTSVRDHPPHELGGLADVLPGGSDRPAPPPGVDVV